MPDEKSKEKQSRGHKINCYIPDELWEKVVAMGVTSPTEATIKAFESFTNGESSDEKTRQKLKSCERCVETARNERDTLQLSVHEKNEIIKELKNTVNILQGQLELAGQRETDASIKFSNYMAQMQTLINQKSIETSGKKRWFEFWK